MIRLLLVLIDCLPGIWPPYNNGPGGDDENQIKARAWISTRINALNEIEKDGGDIAEASRKLHAKLMPALEWLDKNRPNQTQIKK